MITEMEHGASTRAGTPRRERSRGAVSLVAAASLTGALACGPTVSLDEREPVASSSGAMSSSGSSTHASSDGADSTTQGPAPEVPPDLPPVPLPGECPPGCTVDLPVTWTWEDEARPPSGGGEAPQGRWLSAAVAPLDGGWIVADQRGGQAWLTRVDPSGALEWSVPLELECDCEVVDLALYPSGALAVLGQGLLDDFYTIFGVGRFDLDAVSLEWMSWEFLGNNGTQRPRIGSLIPIDDVHAALLLIETQDTGPKGVLDLIELFYYETDYITDYRLIDVQLAGTEPTRRPLGALLPGGEIAMSIPDGPSGSSGYVAWLDAVDLLPFAAEGVPGGSEVVALGPGSELVVASHTVVSPEQVVVEASSLRRAQPPAWSYSAGVPTTSASEPDLAVDELGSAVIALRITAGTVDDPRDTAVRLTRLAPDGAEVWTTSLPLAVGPSPRPLALELTDDDGLLLAGIVGDRLHLERREQACRCE